MLPVPVRSVSIVRVSRSAAPRRGVAVRRCLRLPLWAAGLLVVTASVFGQSSQYTAPGGAVAGGPPTADDVEAQMEAARWQLGPVRLAPWLALRGLTWQQNVFVENEGETDDLSGTVGAGLTAYLPTGPRVFWIAQAMPEYVFWLDLDERNELIGRYGGGVVADLNRLRLTANVERTEQQTVITIESPQQVIAERQGVSAAAQLALTDVLVLALAGADETIGSRLPGDVAGRYDFTLLDRSEQVLSGEVRYQPTDYAAVGVGVERTETDFDSDSRDLSSTGTSPFASLRLTGNRISVDARVVQSELEPAAGSNLPPVEQTDGLARLTLTPGWRFTFGLYGSRSITYALDADYSHLTDERLGAEVSAPFGERLTTRAWVETGAADFEPLGTAPPRSDDLSAYGAEATYRVGEWLSYRAGFQQVNIDSDLPEFDRDYFRITSSFVLSTGDWVWR